MPFDRFNLFIGIYRFLIYKINILIDELLFININIIKFKF